MTVIIYNEYMSSDILRYVVLKNIQTRSKEMLTDVTANVTWVGNEQVEQKIPHSVSQ